MTVVYLQVLLLLYAALIVILLALTIRINCKVKTLLVKVKIVLFDLPINCVPSLCCSIKVLLFYQIKIAILDHENIINESVLHLK